jgi:hypothetical protein
LWSDDFGGLRDLEHGDEDEQSSEERCDYCEWDFIPIHEFLAFY